MDSHTNPEYSDSFIKAISAKLSEELPPWPIIEQARRQAEATSEAAVSEAVMEAAASATDVMDISEDVALARGRRLLTALFPERN